MVGRKILSIVTATWALAGAAHAAPPSAAEWQARAKALFGTLPAEATDPANPVTEPKVTLGRMLYYETRLSKNHDISCNSCHQLDRFGVDGEPTSPGHRGQRGDRNSPTTLNAALHIAQFWDGRAANVEEQAKGPILNPVEMATVSAESCVDVLESIPGYAPLFAAAFPGGARPITYDNLAKAIGAFERRLITPAPLDRFIAGDATALSPAELAGLARFVDTGCTTCHVGVAVGGGMFQKLGLVKPYPTDDPGRQKVTGNEADRGVFKVPSLRNIAKTGPYFHDGSVKTLPEAVRLMARHQLGKELDDRAVGEIVTFLGALTGTVDASYVAKPALPPSGPRTPKPDPS
jgi:cytochrome c peroxidase